jgi:divalent metal cation (Fe/Co/Zn/Cd) transporter
MAPPPAHELRAEVEIVANSALSFADAHAIAEEVHHRLHDIHRLT